ncbi:MAG: ATP phosphoribosyltransferase regulatory subunit [Phototrophicaceae bacterium]|jgi:histidyl-tRNA synthetase
MQFTQRHTHGFIYEDPNLTQLVSRLHQHMQRYGYQNVQVAALADTDLFLTKAGDHVIAELFTFERYGKSLALRPEFTALAAHRYAAYHPDGKAIVRWQFNGSIFREKHGTPPSEYQQMSIGAELIGYDSPLAEAEVILMAYTGLTDIAGLGDIMLSIGHAGLIQALIRPFALDPRTERFVLNHLDKLTQPNGISVVLSIFDQYAAYGTATPVITSAPSEQAEQDALTMLDMMFNATQHGETMGGRNRNDIVRRVFKKRQQFAQRQQVSDALELLQKWVLTRGQAETTFATLSQWVTTNEARRMLNHWRTVVEQALVSGIPETAVEIAPGMIRDWEYYTGTVFNLRGLDGTVLGGGGRYDELMRLLGADDNVPAVGFAYYVGDILRQLPAQTNAEGISPLVILTDSPFELQTIAWANALRQHQVACVILPLGAAPRDTSLLIGQDSVRYADQTYTLDRIHDLLTALQQGLSTNP